jgi:hypothetical protein
MNYKGIKMKLAAVSVFVIILIFMSGFCMAWEGTSENEETDQLIRQQYDMGGLDRIRDELEEYADDESLDLLGGYDADELMNDLLTGVCGNRSQRCRKQCAPVPFQRILSEYRDTDKNNSAGYNLRSSEKSAG